MKLVGLWLLWLAVYIGEELAPQSYYDPFPGNLLNSLLTFGLMIAVFACYRTRWAKLYGLTATAQILLNLVDITLALEENLFNFIADIFNSLECLLLFFTGGVMAFRDWYADRRNRMDIAGGARRHQSRARC